MIAHSVRRQASWLPAARAKGRESFGDHRRTTQLMRAVHEGNEQRVRELVTAGAPLNPVDRAEYSALRWAARLGHDRIVKLLLDGKYEGVGADMNQRCSDDWTPLISACNNNKEAVVRLLLERGADATLQDRNRQTALSIARRANHAAIVALLQAHGVTA